MSLSTEKSYISFVEGSKTAKGGKIPLADMDLYLLADLDGGPIRGGPEHLEHQQEIC